MLARVESAFGKLKRNHVKKFCRFEKFGRLERSRQSTDMCFASFLSGGFTTMAVMNPPEKKLEKKRTSVQP